MRETLLISHILLPIKTERIVIIAQTMVVCSGGLFFIFIMHLLVDIVISYIADHIGGIYINYYVHL